jgi:hypothetical protein
MVDLRLRCRAGLKRHDSASLSRAVYARSKAGGSIMQRTTRSAAIGGDHAGRALDLVIRLLGRSARLLSGARISRIYRKLTQFG